MKNKLRLFNIFLLALLPLGQSVLAQEELPVVRAILFYSYTCPHCEEVIIETLQPLSEKYGGQLDIIWLETQDLHAQNLFREAIEFYSLPPERAGKVPMLILEDIALVGSWEISEYFPEIIEEGLANGGIELPAIPGLAEMLEDARSAIEGHSSESVLPEKLTMGERFALDPAGNTVSVVILLGMLAVVGIVAVNLRSSVIKKDKYPLWLIPALIVIGIIAASYLAFVEMTHTEAVCGPVGDCNTVQQSKYATLFGFLPVGVLGVIGYLLMLFAWGIKNYGKEEWKGLATMSLWAMAVFGTLFSIYLTFLEPFVIGATCMWCITSAVVQTAIFWLATNPVKGYIPEAKSAKSKRHKHRKKGAPKRRKRH